MKYLILSNNNSANEETSNSTVSKGNSSIRWTEKTSNSTVSKGNSNSTLIDASNMSAAKNILQKSLNRNNINQIFEIIDLVNSEKKHYVVQKKK
jgi:hypothetical protein